MTTFHKLYIVLDFCFCNIFCHADNVTHTHIRQKTPLHPFFVFCWETGIIATSARSLDNIKFYCCCYCYWSATDMYSRKVLFSEKSGKNEVCFSGAWMDDFCFFNHLIFVFDLTVLWLYNVLLFDFVESEEKKVNYVKSVAQHHQKRETAGMAQVARPRWPQVSLKSALKRTDWIS